MAGRQAAAITDVAAGLEGQLADFFQAHYHRLIRLAALVCHSEASVEDAVQAAMEQAWRRRDSLRDASRLKPWLDQIVVREFDPPEPTPVVGTGAAAAIGTQLRLRTAAAASIRTGSTLKDAFRKLPAEQRAVVALHLYAGYPVEQTADLMSVSIETTRSRLRLARQRLRRELGEDER